MGRAAVEKNDYSSQGAREWKLNQKAKLFQKRWLPEDSQSIVKPRFARACINHIPLRFIENPRR